MGSHVSYVGTVAMLWNQVVAGEAMPPSKFLTGPASSGRLVCARSMGAAGSLLTPSCLRLQTLRLISHDLGREN